MLPICHRCLHKYAWVKPLKDKKSKTVIFSFIEMVNKCKYKANN